MKLNLKSARKSAGIKQTELADALKTSKQTVNKWEMGRAPVAKKHWTAHASLLNVSENELEQILVQTLLDGCLERGESRMLINAQTSRLYRPELLRDAFRKFNMYTQTPLLQPQPTSNEQTTELREQILKLREENLKLRETIIELRERCATPYQAHASTPSQFTSNLESEIKE
jgi:transcriptional regulator with XRE-family HTH domain